MPGRDQQARLVGSRSETAVAAEAAAAGAAGVLSITDQIEVQGDV